MGSDSDHPKTGARGPNSNEFDPPPSEPPPPKRPPYSDPVTDAEYAKMASEREELRRAAGALETKGPLKSMRGPNAAPNTWVRYSGLGIQMAVTLVLPVLGGLWLDNNYGWDPWGVVLGGLVGATASITGVILTVQRGERAEEKAKGKGK
jgi:hypothetical protein